MTNNNRYYVKLNGCNHYSVFDSETHVHLYGDVYGDMEFYPFSKKTMYKLCDTLNYKENRIKELERIVNNLKCLLKDKEQTIDEIINGEFKELVE